MSYRYDKQQRSRRRWYGVAIVFLALFIFTPLPRFLFDIVEKPLEIAWQESQKNKEEVTGLLNQFYAKSKLLQEQEVLQRTIDTLKVDMLRTEYLQSVLTSYQTIREEMPEALVADVVLKTPLSPADTLMLNKGSQDTVAVGDTVITENNVLLGTISYVYDSTSYVYLATKDKQQSQAVLYPHGESITLIGHGNSYRAEIGRDVDVAVGDIAYSQFTPGRIMAVVQKVIFDPRDPFKQVYLSLPVNIRSVQSVGIITPTNIELPIAQDNKEEQQAI